MQSPEGLEGTPFKRFQDNPNFPSYSVVELSSGNQLLSGASEEIAMVFGFDYALFLAIG